MFFSPAKTIGPKVLLPFLALWLLFFIRPACVWSAQEITYDGDIHTIISKNCGRCHSGSAMNLMDYGSLKAYADNGLLRPMVAPGGPMSRFAGNDAGTLLTWIDNGALKQPATKAANFFSPPGGGRIDPGADAFPVDVQPDRITYDNTIKFILARDCLECHSGPFRNLTSYLQVKFYSDNRLLKTLVQPGGQMHRFAGADSQSIIAWVDNGAAR